MLVTEEQVEVLEGLGQEEGLLHVVLVPPNLEKGQNLAKCPEFYREGQDTKEKNKVVLAC